MRPEDARAELGDIAASLRAYLEVLRDSGATGIPRGKRVTTTAATAPSATTASPSLPSPAVAAPVRTSPTTASPTKVRDVMVMVDPFAEPSAPPGTGTASGPAAPVLPPVPREIRLPQLGAEVAACTKCVLSKTRTQTVFSRGNPAATLCFVGEAPGADEDAQGLPFVGRAGQLLDKMINAMGLSPENDVYVCNIIKCRPPENRKPDEAEMAACIPYLHEQLALVKPKVIVAMGNTAVGALLGTKLGITKLRGEWKLYKGTTLVMPTYHPSYLLRPSAQQVEAKKQAWEDLQTVMRELKIPFPARKKD